MQKGLYLQQHNERKKKVLTLLEKAMQYCDDSKAEDMKKVFSNLHHNVTDGEFSIVVVGEFSAGKSTFLNALMGEKYLPSSSSETTATVNFLKHKSRAPEGVSAIVYYTDKSKPPVYTSATLENIEKYTTTSSSLKVAEEIEKVELYLDSKFLNEGVMLVDTPGLNGVKEGHREITERQIEKSHVCIYMFSLDQPGRDSDFRFLKQLKSKVNTVLFVINRIDEIKVKEQSLDDVLDTLKENYHRRFPEEQIPEILPLAAYPALVSRSRRALDYRSREDFTAAEKQKFLEISKIEAFEERLWTFLTRGEKTKAELLAPVQRVENLLLERKMRLENEIETLNTIKDSGEINDAIMLLTSEVESLHQDIGQKESEIRSSIHLTVKETRENLKTERNRLKDKYTREIDSWNDTVDIVELVEDIEQRVKKDYQRSVEMVMDEFAEQINEAIRDHFSSYLNHISEKLNIQENNLHITFDKELDIERFNLDYELDKYEQQQKRLEEEIDALDKEYEQNEEDKIKALLISTKIEQVHRELNMLKDKKSFFDESFPRPEPVLRTETKRVERPRGGLLGKIEDFLVGPKIEVEDTPVYDHTRVIEYDKVKKEKLQQFEIEEIELNNELKKYTNEKYAEQYDYILKKLDKVRRRKAEELANMGEEHRKNFQTKYQAFIRKVKRQTEDYIDNLDLKCDKEVITYLKRRENEISGIILDVVLENISKVIQQKKEEIELKKKQIESSVEEKMFKIGSFEKEIAKIKDLLEGVIELEMELNLLKVDVN